MTVKKAYIQSGDDGMLVGPNLFALWEGARFLGLEPESFHVDQLSSLPLTRETMVAGWVKTVHDALRQVGAPVPPPLDYPERLRRHLGRDVQLRTIGQVHDEFVESEQTGSPVPVFVKPLAHKLFKGHTIERFSHLAETSYLPRDTLVWRSPIVDFTHEYRCFVRDGCLLDVRRYYGDPWVTPDKMTVIHMMREYTDAPVAYSLDVGVTQSGRTLLVEVNDAYSLGTYGFDGLSYAEMVIARWEEMTRV